MTNLKLDLLNKHKNDKYYAELELVRLVNDSTLNYKSKIDLMSELLENIAILNAQIALVEQYFQDTPPQQEERPIQQPTHKHQGQTHGE